MRREKLLVVTLAVLCLSRDAAAQDSYEARLDSILESRSVPAESLFHQANRARELNNHQEAMETYGRVFALVPDFWVAARRQAGERLMLGDRPAALEELREVVQHDSSAYSLAALASALLQTGPQAEPTAQEVAQARLLSDRAASLMPDDPSIWATVCLTAMATSDTARMSRGSAELVRLAPDQWPAWRMAVLSAMMSRHPDQADAALARGVSLGMPPEVSDELRKWIARLRSEQHRDRLLIAGAWVVGGWLLAFFVLMLLGLILSRSTLGAAGRQLSDPTGKAVGVEGWIRRTYGAVLWLCCAYYYVSMPLLLALVLAVGGGVVYLFLAFGHIPIKLLALVVILTLGTVFSIVRSLFVRGIEGDPGERLALDQQPRFRELLERVASRIGTRPVDNVYLTPGTELAVMERGSLLGQLKGQSERCLILGAAVLEGMRVVDLKAVLAHEYGHFSNRDTAGGSFALSVRRSLYTMAVGLAKRGAAGWYNPAWLFLRGFDKLFLRISQGATRLQEVLADRWAAFAYGSQAFVDGLTHVIAASVRFEARATAAVNEALRERRPMPNLYQYRTASQPEVEQRVADGIDEAMNAAPSEYDSHPAPSQRLAWVRALDAPPLPEPEDLEPAWSLFADRPAMEQAMTSRLRAYIESTHEVKFAAEEAEAREESASAPEGSIG